MTAEQRHSAFATRVRDEFNALYSGAKHAEITDRLDDGAAGKTLAILEAERDAAIANAVNALLGGVAPAGDSLQKLYALIQAISGSGYATLADVNTAITSVIGAAPAALDTLEELAAAFNNDANTVAALTTAIGNKANSADVYTTAAADTTFLKITDFNTLIGNPDADLVAIFETGLAA